MEHVMRQYTSTEVVHQHQVVKAVLYGRHAADADGGARERVGAVEGYEGGEGGAVAELLEILYWWHLG